MSINTPEAIAKCKATWALKIQAKRLLLWQHTREADGGCWEWTATRWSSGYGRYLNQTAHRIAWELTHGPIPDGLQVCHHCDNRPCIRPDHLFLGTGKDNMQDAARKGRLPKGDTHPARLYPETWKRTGRLIATRPKTAAQIESCRRVMSKFWIGKHQSAEHIRKRALARTGVPLTEEHKQNIRDTKAAKREAMLRYRVTV